MPNQARGEFVVKIGEVEYTLRPSFGAIQEIESRYDGIFAVERRIKLDGMLTAVATIIWAAATDGGKDKKPTLREVGDAVIGHGQEAVVAAQKYLLGCMTGVFDPAEEGPDSSESEKSG